jgi:hypothetical protein
MSDLELIRGTLKDVSRRFQLQVGWGWFWKGFFAGAVLWLLVLSVYKIWPVPVVGLVLGGLVWVLLSLAALVWGVARRPGAATTARWMDDRQHYQERLSTALEVAEKGGAGRWEELVIADAASCARDFDIRRAMPWKLPRLARWSLVVLVLAAGLGFVPEHRSAEYLDAKRQVEAIREAGEQLESLVKRELALRPPSLETTRESLEGVQELGRQLGKVKLNRDAALQRLASMTDRIEQQLRELAKEPAMRKLAAGERVSSDGDGKTAEGLQKQMEALQQELGKAAGRDKDLGEMQDKLGELRQAASELAAAEGAEAEAMKQQMAAAMAELASQAGAMGLDVAGLQEAIEALQSGDMGQMLQDLDAAFMDLERLAQMSKAMQDLRQQLAQMGQNLAEQLDKGQGLAAYASVQRMLRELAKADLSTEQMQEMMQEVSDAVGPGMEYGELGELLKSAAESLEQGDRAGASESLAKAAEELKRLMEQMGDCEGLASALAALKAGQMCVGNCSGWGLAKGPGRPGFKPGGKPGAGVGTWADEGLWMDPQNTGLGDNSGIERPAMESKGQTDRGAGELSDALTPTKVRGQVSAGGPMPSVTLRGVSIRGQSRVDYEERVTAAQSEAQSALNQDLVPRAYRGAVKDYFDDLK